MPTVLKEVALASNVPLIHPVDLGLANSLLFNDRYTIDSVHFSTGGLHGGPAGAAAHRARRAVIGNVAGLNLFTHGTTPISGCRPHQQMFSKSGNASPGHPGPLQ